MFNSKKIIDERQERQSLKNGSIVCSVMMVMLGALIFIQTLFLNRGLSYIWPEFITLMTGCVLIFILEIRQGNVYTEMNAKTKLTIVLYVLTALIASSAIGIRNYMLFHFAPWMIVLVILPMFVVMLTAMLILHFAYFKMSKKRLEKLERELDGEESRK
jgi:hypothetical protein